MKKIIQDLVTIIIPVYNAELYISKTIESVISQSYTNFEVIIVNDGSQDDSLTIINNYKNKYSFIHLIDKANTGVSDSRNCGIKISKGEYIAFLDSDDIWEKDNLKIKINALKASDKSWVYSNVSIIDNKGVKLSATWTAPKKRKYFIDDMLFWDKSVVFGPCSNIILKSKKLGEVLFDENISSPADKDFAIKLSMISDPIYIDQKLWRYRIHDNSMSNVNMNIAGDMLYMYNNYSKNEYFRNRRIKYEILSQVYKLIAMIYMKNNKEFGKGAKLLLFSLFFKIKANFYKKSD